MMRRRVDVPVCRSDCSSMFRRVCHVVWPSLLLCCVVCNSLLVCRGVICGVRVFVVCLSVCVESLFVCVVACFGLFVFAWLSVLLRGCLVASVCVFVWLCVCMFVCLCGAMFVVWRVWCVSVWCGWFVCLRCLCFLCCLFVSVCGRSLPNIVVTRGLAACLFTPDRQAAW